MGKMEITSDTTNHFTVGSTQELEDKVKEIKAEYEKLNPNLKVEIEVSESKHQPLVYKYSVKLLRKLD